MNIKEAKALDLVDYLARLGHHPTRTAHPYYWYKSPLREDKHPSFRVNRKLNGWRDFADGTKGNLVDFGIQYHKCSIAAFLKKLAGSAVNIAGSGSQQEKPAEKDQHEEKRKIKIISVKSISSLPLIRYCRDRRILDVIARQYLQEAVYELNEKNYYALAFKNDQGGYELRNKYFKGSSSPKDSTYINNGARAVTVFEGFFNFLSHRTIFHRQDIPPTNYLILNSTAFFEQKLPLMQAHEKVHLFLDNDKIGQKCSQQALGLDKHQFIDHRHLYKGYNDLNDWATHVGQSPQQAVRQTP